MSGKKYTHIKILELEIVEMREKDHLVFESRPHLLLANYKRF